MNHAAQHNRKGGRPAVPDVEYPEDLAPAIRRRGEVIAALLNGEKIDVRDVQAYPDIVQLGDPNSVEPWILNLLRQQPGPRSPRYVLLGGDGSPDLYMVTPMAHVDFLVCKVGYFISNGVRKTLRDPFKVTADEHASAVEMYKRVDAFLREPTYNTHMIYVADVPTRSAPGRRF